MSSRESFAPAPVRHPLGLPAGSVRALLVLQIVTLFWLIVAFPQERALNPVNVPLFLYFLLGLVLAFFAAHGHSITTMGSPHASPWHLPHGFFRLFIVVFTAVLIGYRWHTDRERL